METRITQNDHLVFESPNQGVKAGIVDIGRVAIPSRHQAQVVEHQTEFSSYDPAVIGLPFLASLMEATSVPEALLVKLALACGVGYMVWRWRPRLLKIPTIAFALIAMSNMVVILTQL